MADYAVVDPATGETVQEYPTITDAELASAIDRAAAAGPDWSLKTPLADRVAAIRKVAALHEERKQQLAEIIVREMGKPLEQAVGEVEFAAAIYEYYADNAEQLLADEPIELLDGEGSAIIRRSAFGLLLGIMPWNFPVLPGGPFRRPETCSSATPSCSSTRRSARRARPRWPTCSTRPACRRMRTSTSTRRTTRSPR